MKKVLVIEDDINIRESVCELLEMKNYDISSARNGIEGLRMATQSKPDLILCDIMMPKMSGHEVLESIRNESMNVPFIFLTAMSQKSDIREGMNMGADDYLTKPFNAEDLFMAVETRLKRAEELEGDKTQVLQTIRKDLIQNGVELPVKALHESSDLLLKHYDVYSHDEIIKYVKDLNGSLSKIEGSVKKLVLHQAIQLAEYDRNVRNSLSRGKLKNAGERVRNLSINLAECYCRTGDLFFRQLVDAKIQMPEDVFDSIVREILTNAFQFSNKGSMITIEGTLTDHGYRLIIEDKGMGMRQNTVDKLGSTPWEKADRMGLGVYLSKQLLEYNRGSIKINSKRRQGTTVTLIFPTK